MNVRKCLLVLLGLFAYLGVSAQNISPAQLAKLNEARKKRIEQGNTPKSTSTLLARTSSSVDVDEIFFLVGSYYWHSVTVSLGTIPPRITSTYYAWDNCSGGQITGDAYYEWDQSTDGGTTWQFAVGHGFSYTPPAATQTTMFRVAVYSLAFYPCPIEWAYSNEVMLYVDPTLLIGGSVSSSASSTCSNSTLLLNSTTPATSGVSAAFTYQWQVKTTGNFTDIANANSASYTVTNLTANSTFRRKVKDVNNNIAYSNEIPVALIENAVANITNGATATGVCNVTLEAAIVAGNAYQWQMQDNNGIYQNIAGETNSNYNATQVGMYRVQVSNAVCGTATTVSSAPTTVSFSSAAVATISNGASATGACNVTLQAITAAGYTYQWQMQDNNGAYQNINGATNNSYIATQSGMYRLIVTSIICSAPTTATSSPTTVSLSGLPVATITNGSTASGNCSILLTAATASGNIYQWQLKDNNNVFQNINGATAYTYTATQSGDYRLVVSKANCGANTATSAPISVQLNNTYPYAIITNGSSVTASCSVVLNAATAIGNTYQWQKRDMNNNFSSIDGANSSSYMAMQSGEYRVVVYNNGCSNNASNSAPTTVTIILPPMGDPTTFGPNNWRFFAYNGTNDILTDNVYRGYYDYAIAAFNNIYEPSEYSRAASPSYLPSSPIYSSPWYGCPVDVDNFTLVAKRKGFACGTYNIRIRIGSNEMYKAYLDGVYIGGGAISSGNYVSLTPTPVTLNSNSTLEIRIKHYTSELRFDFEVLQQNIALTAGEIQPAVGLSINYNTVPSLLTSSTAGYAANGALTYQWEKAPTNTGPWTVIPFATGPTYQSPALQQTTYFRRGANNGTCEGPKYTNYIKVDVVNVPVNTPLTGGAITASATSICSGNSVTMGNSNSAYGGTGSLTYSWEEKVGTGNFATVPNANASSYTSGALTNATTFRRKVTDANNNVAYSNEISISIITAVATITNGATVSANCNTTLSAQTATNNSYQWQLKDINNNYQNINGATAYSYTATISGDYRVIVTNTTCGSSTATSSPITVMISYPLPTATITNGSTATGYCNVALSAATGTGYTYQWQLKDINNNYQNINGATASNYTATQSGEYRIVVTNTTCGSSMANSNPITVAVTTNAPIATITNGSTATGACSLVLNATATTGNTYQWQLKDANNNYQNINNATANTYTALQSGDYRIAVTNTSCTYPVTSYSDKVSVTITPIAPTATITNGSTATGSCSVILNAATGTGYTYQWQKKDINNNYVNIASAGASSYPAKLSGEYRVIVYSSNCGNSSAISSPITVTITGVPTLDPNEFGSNNWKFFAYDGIDENLDANVFRGYYNYAIGFFNNIYEPSEYTRAQSPSYLPASPVYSSPWNGCAVDVNYFTLVSKRRGFSCGNYNIRIRVGQNEMYKVYLDGTLIGSGGNSISSLNYTLLTNTPVALNSNSTIEVRVKHFTGDLRFDFEVEQLNPTLTGGYIQPGAAQSVTYNTAPVAFTSSTDATSTNGPLTYQWEKATTNTGPWTVIPNATASGYSSPALLQKTYFRRGASNATTCEGPKYSNNIQVNVTNIPVLPLQAGTIAAASTNICSNGNATISSIADASGGTGSLAYAWEKKTGSGSFSTITNETGSTLSITSLTVSTTYRRKVTDATSTAVYSNEITINVLLPGSIAPATQNIYAGNAPAQITSASPASGHSSAITYQWQSSTSPTGGWGNIVNETNATLQPGILHQNTYYRRMAFTSGCTVGVASNIAQVMVEIPVAQPLIGGTILSTAPQCINAGSIPPMVYATAASGGTPFYDYQWQKNDNGTWVDYTLGLSQDFQPPALFSTTSFRRKVLDINYNIAYTDVITFKIQPATLNAGIIDGPQVICSGTASTLTNVLTACGGSAFVYSWEKDEGNGSWTTISNATAETYNATSMPASTKYRRKVTDAYCNNEAYSNTIEVLMYPTIEAGTVYPATQTVCINEPRQPLALMQGCHYTNGTVTYQWQQSIDFTATWNDIPNATGATYQPNGTHPSVFHRLKVSSTTCNSVAYSNPAVVYISGCYIGKTAPALEVSNASTKAGMKVYPNPAVQGQSITVVIDGAEGNLKATLKGMDGRTYNCTISSSAKGILQAKLPSPLAKGMYLVQVSNSRQLWTEKILVQ